MRALMCVIVVVLGMAALGEARRELHPLFGLSSREELVDLAGYGEEKLSTVLITGSVLCLDHVASSTQPQPVSGARVGVRCGSGAGGEKARKSSWEETVTDEYGDFTIDLPSHLHGIQNLDKACRVEVIHVPSQSHCKASFARMGRKGVELSSSRNGVRRYSTGKIILQHGKPESEESTPKAKTWFANLLT